MENKIKIELTEEQLHKLQLLLNIYQYETLESIQKLKKNSCTELNEGYIVFHEKQHSLIHGIREILNNASIKHESETGT